jgi:hypothetical protein
VTGGRDDRSHPVAMSRADVDDIAVAVAAALSDDESLVRAISDSAEEEDGEMPEASMIVSHMWSVANIRYK